MKIELDNWQKEILAYDGDILLCKGRRIGGTEIFAIKAAETMAKKGAKGGRIGMLSLTEDQAKLIILVALEYLERNYKKFICTGKDRPTQTSIKLKNGGFLRIRAVGNTGESVRGFDFDILGIDEAPRQPKIMWAAARPVITTNAGKIWMWGTPAGKEGYFWEQFDKIFNKKQEGRFKVWYKNSEQVLLNRPISPSWTEKQREGAIRILNEEKADMTELEYGQEYLGLFMDDIMRFFDDKWIDSSCSIKHELLNTSVSIGKTYYLGVDIARMGRDDTVYFILEKTGKSISEQMLVMKDCIIVNGNKITDTAREIIELERKWNFKRIYVDSGGLGAGVYDILMEDPATRRKTESVENSTRAIDEDRLKERLLEKDETIPRFKTRKKEELYTNLAVLMQNGKIKLSDKPELIHSLRSIQFEYSNEDKGHPRLLIYGRYSHIAEALIRACQGIKDKTLNLYCYS